ncbi:uncharacterized protein SETTUDRAFT_184490 [Exserohilum turcica Et28A]|uniref:Uncharacterized protein n=1 Tax=Exserohilum turcicum (strain 28A) TaxID=671987 RepID=R0IRV1_EXST2|nr:uncharacterized protein SETTUDRAFT_184490 [Exserohilum turcica Et28A]EOA87590.1 hypothetical protein SETTUDRAFT_184490 [Exserohilum turcica Et28A]
MGHAGYDTTFVCDDEDNNNKNNNFAAALAVAMADEKRTEEAVGRSGVLQRGNRPCKQMTLTRPLQKTAAKKAAAAAEAKLIESKKSRGIMVRWGKPASISFSVLHRIGVSLGTGGCELTGF